jgi:protein-S-isoprenylcysteine O-methyltransferase Ste14
MESALAQNLPLHVCGWLWLAWVFFWVVSSQFTLKTKKDETYQRFQHTVPTAIGVVTIFHEGRIPELSLGMLYDGAALAWSGVALTAAGHVFSIWARVHLGKYWSGTVALKVDHKIVDTGPYRLVRHPIYTGLLTAALGSAMAAGTAEAFIGLAIMIAGYAVKWKREEKIMLSEFGPAYADYMKRTKVIIPYIY